MSSVKMGTRRSRTVIQRKLTPVEIQEGIELSEYIGYWRPKSRADCDAVPRPCPYVACRYHLYLDVKDAGPDKPPRIVYNFPDLDVLELEHSCALDIAEAGESTLEEVGEILSLSRERIRQVEAAALAKAGVRRRSGKGAPGSRASSPTSEFDR